MHIMQRISAQALFGKAATPAAPNAELGRGSKSMAKSTDLDDAAEVSITTAAVAARLLVVLDELGCCHVLNEQFKTLMSQYSQFDIEENLAGAASALGAIEHFIRYPEVVD